MIQFDLVTPEKSLFSKKITQVVVPGREGDMGVLENHSPVISTLRPGVITVYESDKVSAEIFVSGGFVEINPAGCIVLADEALHTKEIDKKIAEEKLKTAKSEFAKDDSNQKALREIEIFESMLAAA